MSTEGKGIGGGSADMGDRCGLQEELESSRHERMSALYSARASLVRVQTLGTQ